MVVDCCTTIYKHGEWTKWHPGCIRFSFGMHVLQKVDPSDALQKKRSLQQKWCMFELDLEINTRTNWWHTRTDVGQWRPHDTSSWDCIQFWLIYFSVYGRAITNQVPCPYILWLLHYYKDGESIQQHPDWIRIWWTTPNKSQIHQVPKNASHQQ